MTRYFHNSTIRIKEGAKGLKRSQKPIAKRSAKKMENKGSGEYVVFQTLAATRDNICFVTGEPLNVFMDKEKTRLNVNCFAHVLSKGAFPKFRLNMDNIVMVKPEIHTIYDCGDRQKLAVYAGGQRLLELHDELKEEYYKK